MRAPNLADLPPPPPGRTGWPWTEEPEIAGDTLPDGRGWPRISIITPSYHQVQFVEETIRSVLLQGYPNLEYIVVDGASTDGSVDIIRRYEPWLQYFISEPDRGQTHAINKGFALASGDIVAWLNSDDLYTPGSLQLVAEAYLAQPGALVCGNVVNFGSDQARLVVHRDVTLDKVIKFWEGRVWHQPGIFFPRAALSKVGELDESLRYTMDFDLLCRLLVHVPVTYVDSVLTRFRIHTTSKTSTQAGAGFLLENTIVSRRYWHLLPARGRLSYEKGLTRRLVRRAGRQLTYGQLAKCWQLLRMSWQISRKQTLITILRELVNLDTSAWRPKDAHRNPPG
ncbi:MAG: glycosyltransferase [Anaerolineae bacterium]|nr:glycosyltransferase [Anaerolineae bacterium]